MTPRRKRTSTMLTTQLRILLFTVLFTLIAHLNAAKPKTQVIRNFWHPLFQGNRLAYCDKSVCGKPVADEYCRIMGYEYSAHHIIAYNVGLTHFLSDRMRCTGWRCHGFINISCATHSQHNPPKTYHYRQRKFVVPRVNDYRVDWCYKRHHDCGARAANAFCIYQGYLKAIHFTQECEVQATKTIGSQELCFGDECDGFESIVCFR